MFQMVPGHAYRFTYRNHRGEVATRYVEFQSVAFGRNEWHPDPCWMLVGWDLFKQAERTFEISKINTVGLSEVGLGDLTQLKRDQAARRAGQAIEEAYPFGYRSEDKEP